MEGRTTSWCTAAVVFTALLVGCGAGQEEPAPKPSAPASTRADESGGRKGAESGPPDPVLRFEPTVAADVAGQVEGEHGVTRASNGRTLVVWHPPNDFEHVFYRVYDRRWNPVSEIFEVQVELEVVRGLRSSFLARARVSNRAGTRYVLDEWVVISADGQLRRVPREPGEHRLRSGDLRARTPFAHGWALRRASGKVVRIARRPWESPGHFPYVDDRGSVCVVPRGTRSGEPVFTSLDDGMSWRSTTTEAAATRVQSCATAGDRVVVMSGGEYPQYISVFDRASNALLSRIRLGDRRGDTPFSGYGWQLLSDGRLVFDARRPGLLVATDSSNQHFVLRPGPGGLSVNVVGGDLVDYAFARRTLLVSEDAGQTWSRVDLAIPPSE